MKVGNVNVARWRNERMNLIFSRAFSAARLCALVLALGLLCLPSMAGTAGAATVTYTGNGAGLQNGPAWFHAGAANSLFPGTTAAPEASNNTVTIDNSSGVGTPASYAAGGLSQAGDVNGNTVTINSGGRVVQNTYGGYSASGAARNNSVTMNAGSQASVIHGGRSDGGEITGNQVLINGGTVDDSVTGGSGGTTVEVSGNSVTIRAGTLAGNMITGASAWGLVKGNSVTISGGTFGANTVLYGGRGALDGSSAENNSVALSGGVTIQNKVYGGYVTGTGAATGNSVTIDGATVQDEVYGGHSDSGNATGNRVTINSGGRVPQNAYGGYSDSGAVRNNSVTMNAGGLAGVIQGGHSNSGEITGNQVTINGGQVGNVSGGYGGTTAEVSGNSVTVSGSANIGGYVAGGDASGTGGSNGNTVVISGSAQVADGVMGGWSHSGSASNNMVTITGGTINDEVSGGSADAWSTGNVNALAQNNIVNVNGGTITSSVYGGIGHEGLTSGNQVNVGGSANISGHIYGGVSHGSANAESNSILVTGNAAVGGDIYGGYTSAGASATGNAVNNIVSLGGSPALANSTIYGGFGDKAGADYRTGNTLNILNSGIKAKGIANFENYNFTLSGTSPALAVTDAVDISGGNVAVKGLTGGGSAPRAGDRLTLISSAGGLTATGVTYTAPSQPLLRGISLLYDLGGFGSDANNLYLTVNSVQANPQLKSLSEGRLAGLAFVGQGADLIVGPGMYSALLATQRQGYGLAPFASMSGGTSRYETGSHVNVDGVSLMTGLAWRAPLDPKSGSLLAGAFFEAGWGNYDSHNSFSSMPSVKGDGDTSYYGGGVLGRYEKPVGPGGLYGEASFRAGHVSTDFSSRDILGSGGKAEYDSGSAYYGAHAGLGYIWKITDKAALDFSTKYIWTHQNSDSVTIKGDDIRFKASNSQRVRTGARFSYAVNDMFAPYAGAYYDHEFDGKAKASTSGMSIDAPDLKGGTGVGELGLTFKPAKNSGFSLDFGIQGYTGVREGVSGSAQLKFEF